MAFRLGEHAPGEASWRSHCRPSRAVTFLRVRNVTPFSIDVRLKSVAGRCLPMTVATLKSTARHRGRSDPDAHIALWSPSHECQRRTRGEATLSRVAPPILHTTEILCIHSAAFRVGGTEVTLQGIRTAMFGLALLCVLGRAVSSLSHAAGTMHNPFGADPAAIAAGKRLFDAGCAPCHGAGATGGRAPALAGARFTHGDEDSQIFSNIRDGIPGTEMGAHTALRSEDIWRLVSYLRDVSAGGAQPGEGNMLPPDAASTRGEAIFFGPGHCTQCHEINGRGATIGPDLSAIGKAGTRYIRTHMHQSGAATPAPPPPRSRGPRLSLRHVDAQLPDGKPVHGWIRDEDSLSMLLLQSDGSVVRVDRQSLRNLRVTRASPNESARHLSSADRDDVVAFLSRQRGRTVAGDDALAPRSADGPSYSRLLNAASEPQSWLTYWGNYAGSHFSELAQITPQNVGALQARWAAQMLGPSVLQSTPIVADGILYTSGPPGEVYAFDAKTGLRLWKFARKQDVTNPYQINPSNRGVAVAAGRVFVGTLDDLLIAIDARTGRELWERRLADTLEGFTISSAPLVIPGKVIVGVAGGEFGLRGFLDAYDAASGRRLWRFYTIPGPGKPGNETWSGDSWQRGGGGTWLPGSFDAKLHLLYWAIGNPAPSFNPGVRKGDNLYTDSVVAIDPSSGTLRWYYQFTPNDSHDWDSVQDLILTDRLIQGRRRQVLLHADRNGFLYTLDRRDGQFISAVPFVRQTWNEGFDGQGRPIVRPDSVASPDPKQVYPGVAATNFQAPSYDEHAGVLYVAFGDSAMAIASGQATWAPGQTYSGGRRISAPGSIDDARRGIKAIDVSTGRELWRYELTRLSGGAGVLGTRGGVLFAASGAGNLLALDSHSGKPLWHFKTGGPISASPISYAVDGQQYIAIVAGNILYSFALARKCAP